MARKRQVITFETNGTYKSSSLKINGNEIYYESLSIQGDKNVGFDIVIGLSQSKITDDKMKMAAGEQLTPACGFQTSTEEDEYYDDE